MFRSDRSIGCKYRVRSGLRRQHGGLHGPPGQCAGREGTGDHNGDGRGLADNGDPRQRASAAAIPESVTVVRWRLGEVSPFRPVSARAKSFTPESVTALLKTPRSVSRNQPHTRQASQGVFACEDGTRRPRPPAWRTNCRWWISPHRRARPAAGAMEKEPMPGFNR